MNSFYTENELKNLGLNSYGENVLISKKVSIYSPSKISIGDNVRIDDFCMLSGSITLGSNIHISTFCALYGAMGITLEDYTGLSPRVIIFSAMDDFGGDYLIGPVHDESCVNVTGGMVKICRFVQIGAGSIVFPNVIINEGAVAGAMSLVNKTLESWGVYVGTTVKRIKTRKKNLLKFISNVK
jgi:galactoside O-acetyltransferase